MSEQTAGYPLCSTQELLLAMQAQALPLVEHLDIHPPYIEITDYQPLYLVAGVGSIAVMQVFDNVSLRLSERAEAVSGNSPIEIALAYRLAPLRAYNLLQRDAVQVTMASAQTRLRNRFAPTQWPDGGFSLESTTAGSLDQASLLRLSKFVRSIT